MYCNIEPVSQLQQDKYLEVNETIFPDFLGMPRES